MFLPLNDTEENRYGGLPLLTFILIAVNFIMLLLQQFWDGFIFYRLYGSVPTFLISEQGGGALASITSMFLHADIWHLLGNMLFLWVFGRRVEDACGPWRYLAFYLLAGLSADLLSTIIRYNEEIPGIGASGAIAGLLGAYLVLFPGGKIRAFLLLGIIPTFPRIRAFWFLLYWIVFQIIPAVTVLMSENYYQVNYFAHLGGFFSGVFILLFLRPEAFSRFLSNEAV